MNLFQTILATGNVPIPHVKSTMAAIGFNMGLPVAVLPLRVDADAVEPCTGCSGVTGAATIILL